MSMLAVNREAGFTLVGMYAVLLQRYDKNA